MSTDTNVTETAAKPKRTHVNLYDFVKAWQTSNSVEEVAEKTGLKPQTIPVKRADVVKRYGVHLKDFPRKQRSNKVNAEDLREFSERILREEMEKKEASANADINANDNAESAASSDVDMSETSSVENESAES